MRVVSFDEFYGLGVDQFGKDAEGQSHFGWDETEHPRAGDGKFTDGAGEPSAPKAAEPTEEKQESEIDRLMRWRAEQNGKPDAGQARQLIKSYSTGHATLDQVQAAIEKYEALAAKREKRHGRQGWVSPGQRLNLEDGKVYHDIYVWSPGTGGRNITAKFVVKAPRGKALMDVMVRYPEMDYSEKIGSFVAVEPEKMARATCDEFYGRS